MTQPILTIALPRGEMLQSLIDFLEDQKEFSQYPLVSEGYFRQSGPNSVEYIMDES